MLLLFDEISSLSCSESGNLAVEKSPPSSENYYKKLFLDPQPTGVVELAALCLGKPWLCPDATLCKSAQAGFTCAGGE